MQVDSPKSSGAKCCDMPYGSRIGQPCTCWMARCPLRHCTGLHPISQRCANGAAKSGSMTTQDLSWTSVHAKPSGSALMWTHSHTGFIGPRLTLSLLSGTCILAHQLSSRGRKYRCLSWTASQLPCQTPLQLPIHPHYLFHHQFPHPQPPSKSKSLTIHQYNCAEACAFASYRTSSVTCSLE